MFAHMGWPASVCLCRSYFWKFSVESRKPRFVWSDNTPTHLAAIKVCVISLLYGVDVKSLAKLHAAMTLITSKHSWAQITMAHTHTQNFLERHQGGEVSRLWNWSRRAPLELYGKKKKKKKNQYMDIRLDDR